MSAGAPARQGPPTWSLVCLAALVGSLPWVAWHEDLGEPRRGRPDAPLEPVNRVLGDRSFVATYGRDPTPMDPDDLRIKAHLAYVEDLLRRADASALPAQLQQARAKNLQRLHAYRLAGRFPAGELAHRAPTFIDDRGNQCAVAALVAQRSGIEMANALNAAFRHSYIEDLHSPAFDRWVAVSGLSRAELAMIQPTYPPPPLTRSALSLRYDYLTNSAALNGTHSVVSATGEHWLGLYRFTPPGPEDEEVDYNVRHFPAIFVGASGMLGWANPLRALYGGHLQLSAVGADSEYFTVGARIGAGFEGITGALLPELTLPFEVFLSLDSWELRGGLEPRIANDHPSLGWSGAFRLSLRGTFLQLSVGSRNGAFVLGLGGGLASDADGGRSFF